MASEKSLADFACGDRCGGAICLLCAAEAHSLPDYCDLAHFFRLFLFQKSPGRNH